jgi:hypothetical protein
MVLGGLLYKTINLLAQWSFPAAVGPPNEPAPTPGNGGWHTHSQLQVRIFRMNHFYNRAYFENCVRRGKVRLIQWVRIPLGN